MKRLNNKKGAIEMSLSLIIYVIIGLVVLGLVISYVMNSLDEKNLPKVPKGSDLTCDCSEDICVGPNNPEVKKGESIDLLFKVRAYGTDINCAPGTLGSCEIEYEVTNLEGESISNDLLSIKGPGFEVKGGAEACNPFKLESDGSLEIGQYYLKIYTYKGTDLEKSKLISLNIE